MQVKEAINQLAQYVREGELPSCPFLMWSNGQFEVAMFTYYASDTSPITVFGYGQLIKTDGDSVVVEELGLFEKEDELIIIKDSPYVSCKYHKEMYALYYETMQSCIEHFENSDINPQVDCLSKLFQRLISSEAMVLYRQICPSYLEMLNI